MEMQVAESPEPISYSVAEACRVSSIGKTLLYELINADRLKVTKIGRRTFVSASSLKALLEPDG